MDETSHEPVMVWQFLRRHFVRIVIAVVLMAAAYGVVSVYATYQREQRIAQKIQSYGGRAVFDYGGPDLIPQSVRDRLPFLNRICEVVLSDDAECVELLSELGSLTNLTRLGLDNTQVADAGLEHLKGLTNLISLHLDDTQVTDVGLEHLKGLTNLYQLFLNDTQVTDAGLEHLRGLTNLKWLGLDSTEVTDVGLEHLKGLTNLTWLSLINTHAFNAYGNDTQVTDAGLEHLKGLTKLRFLFLDNTQVTAKGRAMLRKTLPNCHIEPNP